MAFIWWRLQCRNNVGYTAKEAEQGKFLIIGAQFEGVTGGTKINDIVSGVQGVDFGDGIEFATLAAQIQVPNADGYDIYYYLNDRWYDDGTAEGATKPGWCDVTGTLVDAELTPGVALWFKSVPGDGSATIAGAVPSVSKSSIDCPEGFALRAGVFPIDITLNSNAMTSSDIVGVDFGDGIEFANLATQIQVPNDGGYDIYYYLNDGWYDDGTAEGATKPGWCDVTGTLVDTSIPAAQGFWTKGVSGAFTLNFNM